MTDKGEQNIINHVALVLDASSSMSHLTKAVVRVVKNLVSDLAIGSGSGELNQETRVTVYTFADVVRCAIYDMDVTRLVQRLDLIDKHYVVYGNTALAAATHLAIDDLRMTPEKYGQHGFLAFVVTDGEENASSWQQRNDLPSKLNGLPEHWTLACLVPNTTGVWQAKQRGFPAGNVQMWDATSERGVEEVGRVIQRATRTYMEDRAKGKRGTKTLFTPNTAQLNTTTVTAAGLKPLDPAKYVLVPIPTRTTIKEFVEGSTSQYRVGQAYYQLTGSQTPKGKRGIIVQGNKAVAVQDKSTSKVYTGPEARQLVGLPDHDVTVDPQDTKGEFNLFVQSTSTNRILYPGTRLLLMTG